MQLLHAGTAIMICFCALSVNMPRCVSQRQTTNVCLVSICSTDTCRCWQGIHFDDDEGMGDDEDMGGGGEAEW